MSAKIIMVTGGRGMLGHAIEDAVKTTERRSDEQWHFVDIEDCDLLDNKATCDMFERLRPTHVVHLAAFVGGLYRMLRYNHDMFTMNVTMNNNVLSACHKYKVQKVVSALSIAAFPDNATLPLNETQIHDGIPNDCHLGYAMSKRMIDIFNRTYQTQYDSGIFTSVIPINMFGPYDNFNLEDGHVVANIIHKTHLAKQTGEAVTLYGTGAARRQFLFAPDAAKLMIWVLREYNEIEPLLLSNDPMSEMSIQDVAERIAMVMQYTGEILHDKSKPEGRLQWPTSNAKLMKYLPNFKYTDFDEAIQLTSDWFTTHFNTARK